MGTRTAWLVALLACGAVGAVACLVDIPDVIDGGGDGSSDASTSNDSPNASDVFVPACDGACGAPVGFAPVSFALNQNTTCPSNTTTMNGAADPGTPGAGACSACDCTTTTEPQCLPQALVHHSGFGAPDAANGCNMLGTFTYLNDGGCIMTGDAAVPIFNNWSVTPNPPVSNGTCTTSGTGDPSKVPSTPSRLCVDSMCSSVCTAPAGFETCFYTTGVVACPTTMTTHHVGTVAVSCPCSNCSVTATECEGTLALYSDTACTTLLDTENVDGGCQANDPNTFGETIDSMRYTPTVVGTVCTPGTPSGSPTAQLEQELTVCCP